MSKFFSCPATFKSIDKKGSNYALGFTIEPLGADLTVTARGVEPNHLDLIRRGFFRPWEVVFDNEPVDILDYPTSWWAIRTTFWVGGVSLPQPGGEKGHIELGCDEGELVFRNVDAETVRLFGAHLGQAYVLFSYPDGQG